MILKRRFAAVLGVLALAGCAAGSMTVYTHEYFAPTYSPRLMNTAGKYDAVPVDIVGNPFDAPKPSLDAAVVDAVRRTAYGGRIAFTANPSGDVRSPFRLVAIFMPSHRIGHADVCAGSRTLATEPPDRFEMMLTYCFGGQSLTSLRARGAGFSGPADPAFDRFVRNATATLFRPRKEDVNGRDDDFMD